LGDVRRGPHSQLCDRPHVSKVRDRRAASEKSIAIGKELGAEKATLEVRTSNVEAIRLYEKLGFRIAGERPRYYARTNENAYIMLLPDFNRLEL